MNVYAMYLPQFHRVKENDEWWGEGFTDWVSTKNATPLFENHYQPHVPQNNYYYDLIEKETMVWQAELMHKYGIDGMCIYHYWFKDGKQLLEKPAENLLHWKDIDMPFCFYWANETWARSWSKIKSANVWSDPLEEKKSNDNGILLEQQYGTEDDWKKHFYYLLPFFTDERYIRIDDKPVFMIYRTMDIDCLSEMILMWQHLAKKEGLDGIYFIGGKCDSRVPQDLDACLYHEPSMHMFGSEYNKVNGANVEDYSDVWNRILNEPVLEKKTYFSGFVGYDDTPRRGKKGTLVKNMSPTLFEYYLTELMAKSEANGSDCLFLNAWNEWGEGMHLEPDERYGTNFLATINVAKRNYKKAVGRYKGSSHNENLLILESKKNKFESYYNLMDAWMTIRESGKNLSDYFYKNDYKKVILYGYGILGRHLFWELSDTGVEVVGIIDQNKDNINEELNLFTPSENLPEFDVMVVTSYHYMREIELLYKTKGYNMVSLEEVVKKIY